MIGQTIGNYVVRDKIGEGGMGVVYVAEHPRIGRKVAIKVLLPEFSQNAEIVARFFTEARASSAIKNEHIIDIIDFGELPDRSSYIIMEWLEGQSLTELLERERELPLERVLHIASGIGRALAAAHVHGIVHRDLKPDNIFLVTRGEDRDFVKVLDFGIAKLLGNEGAGVPKLASKTRTGAIIGTPMYMSPEQCRGVSVDERSDTYSLAVIVYQMLAGRVPFSAEGLGELLLAHMTETPAPLTAPEPIARAVMRALEKDPQKRPTHVSEFIGELTGRNTGPIAVGMPAPASHVSAVDTIGAAAGEVGRTASPSARWPLALAALVLIGGGAGAAVLLHRPAAHVGSVVAAVPTLAPIPVVVPPPAAPAKVAVSLRATPPEATIRVDGEAHANPFSEDVLRDDREHRVEISAPGYAPWKTMVRFDRPVDVGTELTKIDGVPKPVKSQKTAAKPPKLPTDPASPPAVVTKPAPAPKPGGPTIYQGTKGTLRTDDPFAQ